jgi:acyl dehydratase
MYDPADFVVLYPGVYSEREVQPLEQRLAENRALEERGEIDAKAMVEGRLSADVPGVAATLEVTEAMVRYNNAKYDPDNRLLNDREYAKSLGHPDILAMPCFGAHDDTFMAPYPPDARDTLLVSQLGHRVTNLRPVYPGDKLYLVSGPRRMADRTPPEGSIYRHMSLESAGSVYNQRGEKVSDVVFHVSESLRVFKEGKRPEKMGFAELWDAPDWMERPAHYYTDSDWDFIKSVWTKEQPRGAEPLYWEDVKVGDQPNWTADGPIEASVAPTTPYGQGTGGSRTLKNEILDPELCKKLVRNEKTGLYTTAVREDHVPPVPDGVSPFFRSTRMTTTGPWTRRTSIRRPATEPSLSTSWAGMSPSATSTTGWATTDGCRASIGASCLRSPWPPVANRCPPTLGWRTSWTRCLT